MGRRGEKRGGVFSDESELRTLLTQALQEHRESVGILCEEGYENGGGKVGRAEEAGGGEKAGREEPFEGEDQEGRGGGLEHEPVEVHERGA